MSRLHPEDETLDVFHDPANSTDLVPIDTPTKQAIAHACRWDVRHGAARLNGRQVQQMAELVALVEGHGRVSHVPQDSRTPAGGYPSDPQSVLEAYSESEWGHGTRAAS